MKHLIFIFLIFFSCKESPKQSPETARNYKELAERIEAVAYTIDESTDTSKSSFITSANYKSQDGKTGYLILEMKGKPYHFGNVPISVWEGFKSADSKGKFYHANIKGRYNIDLKK